MKYFLIIFSLLIATLAVAATPTENNPSLVVHLLDYLAKDYGGAVQNGKILSKSEFAEQMEFSETVVKTSNHANDLKSNPQFLVGVKKLHTLIQHKASEAEVATLARSLQQDAIRLAHIEVAPRTWPDFAKGEVLFKNNCASCHGDTGHGDGLAAAALNPKPANFHDKEVIWGSSPFKFYNTIRLGVPGTPMVAFSQLTDEEVWSLAFYLKSLGYKDIPAIANSSGLTLKEIASLSDEEIAERFKMKSEEAQGVLATVRNTQHDSSNQNPLDTARNLLDESLVLAQKNDFAAAGTTALRAYLEGIEPVEPKIKANLPGVVEKIEGLMGQYRALLTQKESLEKISLLKGQISTEISGIEDQLSNKKMSPSVAFGAAFSIFLREGFEAVLIIIVLISILKAMGQPQAVRWVHLGWLTAVTLGGICWVVSGLLLSLSGLSRELMEGSISILAVVVLLYVGFWLHRYTEMKKWRTFLESKLKDGLSQKSYLVLASVAFMAVFREAFEVVLFLRAIWLDLDFSGQRIASFGVLASFALLIGFSYLAIKESRKLPLQKLFQICSWTMIALAFILAGKGIHSLQEAGISSISALSILPRLDIVGIFPTIETFSAQLLTFCIFGILLFMERPKNSIATE